MNGWIHLIQTVIKISPIDITGTSKYFVVVGFPHPPPQLQMRFFYLVVNQYKSENFVLLHFGNLVKR